MYNIKNIMRSKSVELQLKQVIYADLSNYDEAAKVFNIPKYSKPKYDIGKMYVIKIPTYILNNPNSVIATNWNNGTCPKSEYLKIYVSKMIGKMLYVDSVGYDVSQQKDTSCTWSGFLPVEEITQIKVL